VSAERESLRAFRRQQRLEREKRIDELVKKSMRVGVVVSDDGRLVRFAR
jgi:hypothetical protein